MISESHGKDLVSWSGCGRVHFVFAESSLHKILGVLSLNAPHTSFKFGVSLETLMEIDKVKHK